jgi:hypothetical protein
VFPGEGTSEGDPTTVDARFHGTDRGAQGLGDLVVWNPLDVVEDQRGPELLGDLEEGALDVDRGGRGIRGVVCWRQLELLLGGRALMRRASWHTLTATRWSHVVNAEVPRKPPSFRRQISHVSWDASAASSARPSIR